MKKNNITKKVLLFTAVAALTVVGFIVIPTLIDKFSTKAYKVSLKKEDIDFDEMGPEIVPKDKEK